MPDAWAEEPKVLDEALRTRWAEPGWHAWNGKSPELEWCEWVRALVLLEQPSLVIETGVGQGYVTRRIASALPARARLLAFESDEGFRARLRALDFWGEGRGLSERPSPVAADMVGCGLLVADSSTRYRMDEIRLWVEVAPAGSVVIVHDVSAAHPDGSIHRKLAQEIGQLEEEIGLGVQLPNPRGGWLKRHP